jgi:hypothetical protein
VATESAIALKVDLEMLNMVVLLSSLARAPIALTSQA